MPTRVATTIARGNPRPPHSRDHLGGRYGNDAVLANYERWHEAWEGAETTLEEVIGHGDRVFVTVRFQGRGRASGIEIDTRLYEVFTLRDGKVLRIDEYEHRADALEAAGLSE